jgi:hypothetical protein
VNRNNSIGSPESIAAEADMHGGLAAALGDDPSVRTWWDFDDDEEA